MMKKILMIVLSLLSTSSFAKSKTKVFQGTFHSFAEAAGSDFKIHGKVTMKAQDAHVRFHLDVQGLDPKEVFVSHVHAKPCSIDNAGGHYKFDPSVSAAKEENEIWFSIAPHVKSVRLDKKVDEILRPDAKSVVIHRMKGEEMLKVSCADLLVQ